MGPALAMSNSLHLAGAYAIVCRYGADSTRVGANGYHIGRCDFGASVIGPATDETSPSSVHIGNVIGLGSEPHMVGIDTSRRIAVMSDDLTRWNRPARQNPSHSMCALLASFPTDKAITIPIKRPVPEDAPAGRGLYCSIKRHALWQRPMIANRLSFVSFHKPL